MENQNILIIDDDLELTRTLEIVLTARGYTVQSAPDSAEGIAKARLNRPDCIILDVMMRTMGEGIDAAQGFKGDKDLKGIPIIMMTSVQEETGFMFDPVEDGDYLPVDVFLPKPVDPRKLLEEIGKLLA